jgi:hypothetical protein
METRVCGSDVLGDDRHLCFWYRKWHEERALISILTAGRLRCGRRGAVRYVRGCLYHHSRPSDEVSSSLRSIYRYQSIANALAAVMRSSSE